MDGSELGATERARVGLCADCVHARRIPSSHGSTFFRCQLADSDPAFRKYPQLPMIHCDGYVPPELPSAD
jgi:hypothetical protein